MDLNSTRAALLTLNSSLCHLGLALRGRSGYVRRRSCDSRLHDLLQLCLLVFRLDQNSLGWRCGCHSYSFTCTVTILVCIRRVFAFGDAGRGFRALILTLSLLICNIFQIFILQV